MTSCVFMYGMRLYVVELDPFFLIKKVRKKGEGVLMFETKNFSLHFACIVSLLATLIYVAYKFVVKTRRKKIFYDVFPGAT